LEKILAGKTFTHDLEGQEKEFAWANFDSPTIFKSGLGRYTLHR